MSWPADDINLLKIKAISIIKILRTALLYTKEISPSPSHFLNHWKFLNSSHFYNFVISTMLHKWNHRVCNLDTDFLLLLHVNCWKFIQVVWCINSSFPFVTEQSSVIGNCMVSQPECLNHLLNSHWECFHFFGSCI